MKGPAGPEAFLRPWVHGFGVAVAHSATFLKQGSSLKAILSAKFDLPN